MDKYVHLTNHVAIRIPFDDFSEAPSCFCHGRSFFKFGKGFEKNDVSFFDHFGSLLTIGKDFLIVPLSKAINVVLFKGGVEPLQEFLLMLESSGDFFRVEVNGERS